MNRFPDSSPGELTLAKAEQLTEHQGANASIGAVL